MIDILDEMSELIYVTDVDTYEILYMNKTGKQLYNVDTLEGRKCYELLQGESKPCSFCVNCKLEQDSIYTWEHFNKRLGKHMLLKDKLIHWEEKNAHIEIAFDISEQMKEKLHLENAVKSEKFLMECVRGLYDGVNQSDSVKGLLVLLNEYLHSTYSSFVCYEGNRGYHHNKVCRDGTFTYFTDMDDTYLMKEWEQILNGKQIVIIDPLKDEIKRIPTIAKHLKDSGIQTAVISGLYEGKQLIGYILSANPEKEMLQNVHVMYQTISYFLLVSMKRWKDEQLLEKLSLYDALTGLKNRNCFSEECKVISQKKKAVGVVYLDLNGLKDINDKYGHKKGDEALIECASTLRKIFARQKENYLYRLGGDEFAIICDGIEEQDFIEKLAELKKHSERYTSFKAAIGFVWSPDSTHIDHLISDADFKMYEDKKRFYRRNLSSNRYRHYNDDVLELTKPGVLDDRIQNRSFDVYLQPKFTFCDQSLLGAEALIRYCSPDGKILSPGQFLPLLEDANLIAALDFHVFEIICSKQKEWKNAGQTLVPISTNFSRYSLLENDFTQRLDCIVKHYEVDKEYLEIEITETVEGLEWFDMIQRIEEIRNAGYRISIDDFGAHYANLSLFTSIEFSVLKIDKSLIDNIVANVRAQSVISSIVDICKSMDVHVIVEGVENFAQFDTLKRLGCEGIQGYLFSRPLPLKEYEKAYVYTKEATCE